MSMKLDNSLILAAATAAGFGILILMIFFPVPTTNKEMMIAFGGIILGFFFGSSINKQRKENPNETADTPTDSSPAP